MNLLFNEHPLVVSPTLAKELGNLNEAVFLQQLHYWLEIKRQTGKNFVDGKYWTYNSIENWLEQFPWLTISTLRRTIASLIKKGYVIKGNYNRKKMDHTTWYTIAYDKLDELGCKVKKEQMEAAQEALHEQEPDAPQIAAPDSAERSAQNEQIELPESTNRSAQNEQIESLKMNRSNCSNWTDRSAQNEQIDLLKMNNAIPETNSEINTENTKTEINQKTTTTTADPVSRAGPSTEADDVLAAYNALCPSFPRASSLTPRREMLLHALFCRGYRLPEIRQAFEYAEQSDFLSGRSSEAAWARFDFEWLIEPSNFVNVLEGKFDNIPERKKRKLNENKILQEKMQVYIHRGVAPIKKPNEIENPVLREAMQRHLSSKYRGDGYDADIEPG